MTTDLALSDFDGAQGWGGQSAPSRRMPHPEGAAGLTRRQKAAIVVRLLLAEGASLPLQSMPDNLQAELTQQMSQMRFVDRETLREVIEEFADELDTIGLSFPDGMESILKILDGAIAPDIAARLRRQSGAIWGSDPWEVIAEMPEAQIRPLLERERPEIGAVILSKLPVGQAAALLGKVPGPLARRLALAVSETGEIPPDTVRRIGVALAAQLQAIPPRAFTTEAVKRLGSILNITSSLTRDDLLAGLEEEDAETAEAVRRAIFTFRDIPTRLNDRDVANVARAVGQVDLILLATGAEGENRAAVEFMLSNMSQRLADSIREEVAATEMPSAEEFDEAERRVVAIIRERIDSGEIKVKDF